MLKRPRDAFDTPDSSSPPVPASKRRYLSSLPGSSPSSSRSVCLSTPYTLPYVRSPFSGLTPHDSPSNPFGLNRELRALTTPRPTGFSKHIVLRMQLVSIRGAPNESRAISPSDAPYRTVQVPLNYSFRLLHMLLLFLFASDARLRVRRRKRVANYTLRARGAPALARKIKASPDLPEEPEGFPEGHLFEVYDSIKLYKNTYRPGVIKAGTGKLYAKLSSARERKLFPEDPSAIKDDDVFGDAGATQEDDADSEDGWDWEPEDDLLLSSVWADGPNLKKGIIYHHTPSTAIHITVNQARVPPRKGIGNAPYVFSAHGGTAGAVRIANVLPASTPSSAPPSTSTSALASRHKGKQRSRSPASDSDNGGWDSSSSGSGSDTDAPERPYADDGEEVPELGPHQDADEAVLERWNAHNAFERFLKREAARERAMRRVPKPPSASASAAAAARAKAGPSASRTVRGRVARLEADVPSSPIRPGGGAHRYGHRRYVRGERDPELDPDPYGNAGVEGEDALPPSSPSTLPIDIPSDCDALWTDTDGELPGGCSAGEGEEGEAGEEEARENMRYMIELPLQTPFPAHPALRRRVRRASERMERQVSKGLSEMEVDEDEDEPEDAADGKEAADGGAEAKGKGKGKGRGQGKGKENRAAAGAPRRSRARDPEPQNDGSPVKARARARARPAVVAVKPEPLSEESDGGGEEGSGEGSDGSVDEDGGYSSAVPWLYMRGPEDGSSTGRGSQWDSDEEV